MIRFRRGLALTATAALTAAMVGVIPATAAVAAPRNLAAQTTFANSSFMTYATGAEVHLNAVTTATSKLANVDQAFSGATSNSGGLTTTIDDPATGSLVQPANAAANSYGRGSGLEVGLGLPTATANQLQLGIAQASSPPVGPVVTKTTIPINIPGVLTAGVLKGIAGAAYLPTFCPVGGPLAYGEGDAAGVGLLGAPPLVGLSGTMSQTAQSTSRSDLVANSDGTFGLSSSVSEIVAPISVNLGTGLSIQISLQGTGVNAPVTLTTTTDGEGHTSTTVTHNGTLTVSLVAAGVTTNILTVNLNQILGASGLVVNANTLPVVGALLTTLGITLNLSVAAPPHALSGFPTGANSLGSEFDLVTLNAALGSLGVANLEVGHMETGVDLASGAISCTIPVAKTANPTTVTAPGTFAWTISIPSSSAALADASCDLTNIIATDKIFVSSGSPTFTIDSISNGGVYKSGTITWPNLGNYHPGDPPIELTVQVSVPATSPAGVLADTANVTAGLGNCTGGATGVATDIGAVQNAVLGGTFTLIAPTVNSVSGGLATTGTGPTLAWVAVGLLVMAEGTRRLLRRSRRTTA